MNARGQCLCGAVSFNIQFPTRWVAHCHCTMCQRAHGAAFVTWVSVNSAQCEWQDTQQRLCWYQSSADTGRGFCSQCGSSLFFRSSRWPGEIHIARANFIDPLDNEPQIQGYYDTHVDWIALGDTLPKKPAPNT